MRFTDLPAEIRDEIYRYLLATDYVRKRRKNPEFREFGGVALGYHHPEHIYGGCLRCQNVWIERSCYSLNILRVSRQIYQESSQIFSKNSWIFVRVNRSLFASHLKGHGFNAFRINSTQGMKVSILALTVRFPTHFPPSRLGWGSSTFVMSTTDAGRLQRALSTATGLVKMKFTFIARHDFPKESNPITEAFLDLRGVGIASVCGPGSRHSLGMMARIISTPLVSTSVHKDAYLELAQGRVRNSLSEAQAYRTNQEWHKTAAKCKTSMVYIIDFFSVYFTGIRRISTQWSLLYDTYEILLTMLVEATFWIGDYDSVVSISEHVRGVNSRRKSTPEGSVRDFRRRALRILDERGVVSLPVYLFRLEEGKPIERSLYFRFSDISRRSYWTDSSTDSSTD